MINFVRNSEISKHDYAFKEGSDSKEEKESNFNMQIKKVFFNIIKPFLKSVPECIRDDFGKESLTEELKSTISPTTSTS